MLWLPTYGKKTNYENNVFLTQKEICSNFAGIRCGYGTQNLFDMYSDRRKIIECILKEQGLLPVAQ